MHQLHTLALHGIWYALKYYYSALQRTSSTGSLSHHGRPRDVACVRNCGFCGWCLADCARAREAVRPGAREAVRPGAREAARRLLRVDGRVQRGRRQQALERYFAEKVAAEDRAPLQQAVASGMQEKGLQAFDVSWHCQCAAAAATAAAGAVAQRVCGLPRSRLAGSQHPVVHAAVFNQLVTLVSLWAF